MPKFLKYALYFIGGYALILGLLALITSNSKCSILSSRSCSALDVVYMVMLVPVAIPVGIYDEYKENKRVNEFIEKRNEGVLRGDRTSLEQCVESCYYLPSDSEKMKALSELAAQKLIRLDDPKNVMLPEQIKPMIVAYSHLQQKLKFDDPLKKQYVERAWSLVKIANKTRDYFKINGPDVTRTGGHAFILKAELSTRPLEHIKPIFNTCLSDKFWLDAGFEAFDLDVLFFCESSLDLYLSSVPDSQEHKAIFRNELKTKWKGEWRSALKKKYPSKN